MNQLLWFKRDLRVVDHDALASAMQKGPVLAVYILEPELWQQPDISGRQFAFLTECVESLQQDMRRLSIPLVIRMGKAVTVLEDLIQHSQIEAVWSHQETWNAWTYTRDKQVASKLRSLGVVWHQPVQNGVIRALKGRDQWARRWQTLMNQPLSQLPASFQSIEASSDAWPSAEQLDLAEDRCPGRQKGGRKCGLVYLDSFLRTRGEFYTRAMSSPVSAYEACSRLSPYLAFGCLSIREVYQAVQSRQMDVRQWPRAQQGQWLRAYRSFAGRLHWHCHFIQKLEDEPAIEFFPMHPVYQNLRDEDSYKYKAWVQGRTGFPLVDACMRALQATGWLNFRMRAMVMSFASYHLWLDWRLPALHLARHFLDYEPGIHYSQVQMQSGTTGINAVRIYNPIKQSQDQDPEGLFIKQWIPELVHMPTQAIHTPWIYPDQLNGYPMPLVNEKEACTFAREQLHQLRRGHDHKRVAKGIVQKHGSRRRRRSTSKVQQDQQLELF